MGEPDARVCTAQGCACIECLRGLPASPLASSVPELTGTAAEPAEPAETDKPAHPCCPACRDSWALVFSSGPAGGRSAGLRLFKSEGLPCVLCSIAVGLLAVTLSQQKGPALRHAVGHCCANPGAVLHQAQLTTCQALARRGRFQAV